MEFGHLSKRIYCNSRQALAEHFSDLAIEEGSNILRGLTPCSSLWDFYEDQLTDKICWPCSEERLALVLYLYLYLNDGLLSEALKSSLGTHQREILWSALLSSETQLINKEQCRCLAEIFGSVAEDGAIFNDVK